MWLFGTDLEDVKHNFRMDDSPTLLVPRNYSGQAGADVVTQIDQTDSLRLNVVALSTETAGGNDWWSRADHIMDEAWYFNYVQAYLDWELNWSYKGGKISTTVTLKPENDWAPPKIPQVTIVNVVPLSTGLNFPYTTWEYV